MCLLELNPYPILFRNTLGIGRALPSINLGLKAWHRRAVNRNGHLVWRRVYCKVLSTSSRVDIYISTVHQIHMFCLISHIIHIRYPVHLLFDFYCYGIVGSIYMQYPKKRTDQDDRNTIPWSQEWYPTITFGYICVCVSVQTIYDISYTSYQIDMGPASIF